MTAEPDLLPLPSVLLNWPHPTNHSAIRDYARANLAELQREVEGLRAEVETRKEDYATLTAMWRADEAKYRDRAEQAEARAARLAEALRDARECGNDGDWQSARRIIDAALDQETTNG